MTAEKMPKTALVVDDEPLIRWSISEGLAAAGWIVRQASTGVDARAAADALTGQPFVIVLDLRLPDVSDLSLMHHLRTVRPDVPLIIMTAYGTPEQASIARAAGVYRLLEKPFDVRRVVALVDEAYTAARWPEDES